MAHVFGHEPAEVGGSTKPQQAAKPPKIRDVDFTAIGALAPQRGDK